MILSIVQQKVALMIALKYLIGTFYYDGDTLHAFPNFNKSYPPNDKFTSRISVSRG